MQFNLAFQVYSSHFDGLSGFLWPALRKFRTSLRTVETIILVVRSQSNRAQWNST